MRLASCFLMLYSVASCATGQVITIDNRLSSAQVFYGPSSGPFDPLASLTSSSANGLFDPGDAVNISDTFGGIDITASSGGADAVGRNLSDAAVAIGSLSVLGSAIIGDDAVLGNRLSVGRGLSLTVTSDSAFTLDISTFADGLVSEDIGSLGSFSTSLSGAVFVARGPSAANLAGVDADLLFANEIAQINAFGGTLDPLSGSLSFDLDPGTYTVDIGLVAFLVFSDSQTADFELLLGDSGFASGVLDFSVTATAVPGPATITVVAGFAGLMVRRRRPTN